MKKIMFLGGLFLSAMTFVACSDDYTDWAEPQTNPQEESVTLPGYTASATSAIDLAAVAGDSVQILSLSDASLPEGAAVGNTRIEVLPADETSDQKITLGVDSKGRVGKADLQGALETFYGKRPTERTLAGQVYSNIIIDGQTFLVNAGEINVVATPEAPYIANAYYLIGDVAGGWDTDHIIKFNHSGADVYEDPVFTVTFTASGSGSWKIIPQGNIDNDDLWHSGTDGVVGVSKDGDTALEGTLVTVGAAGGEPGAGRIEKAGMYRMTINMMDYTYKIEEMAATYYVYGAVQGWNNDPTTGKTCAFYPETTSLQSYTTKWTGAWDLKFWSADGWGNDAMAYGSEVDGDSSESGKIVGDGAAQAISAPSEGYYTFTIDMGTMTYTWTKLDNQTPTEYNSIGLVGDFTGWADGADVVMKQVTPHNWYVNTTIASDGGVKFRADGVWVTDWGADVNIGSQAYGTGTQGGANITVPSGTYDIYMNDITGQFVFVAQ